MKHKSWVHRNECLELSSRINWGESFSKWKKYFTCSGTQLTPEIRMPAIRRMGGPRQDQYPGPGLKVYHQNQNLCSNIFSNIFPLFSWIFTILEATCPRRALATTTSLLVNEVTWPIEFRPSKVFEITNRTTSIYLIYSSYSIFPDFRVSKISEITN